MSPKLTGQGFAGEKIFAYATLIIGTTTLLIIALDYLENSKHRKVMGRLANEQYKYFKKQNIT